MNLSCLRLTAGFLPPMKGRGLINHGSGLPRPSNAMQLLLGFGLGSLLEPPKRYYIGGSR